MKKIVFLNTLLLPAVVFFSCHPLDVAEPEGGGAAYLDLPDSAYSYFGPQIAGNPSIDKENNLATLGRVIFYDRHLSVNNSVSCGSCHKQAFAFSDNVAKSRGFENRLTGRNTPPLQNLRFSSFVNGPLTGGKTVGGNLFWDGRESDLNKLITRPVSNHVEMGIEDISTLPEKLSALPYYKELFVKAYGEDGITVEKISESVATFIMAIQAINTRFDQEQKGQIRFTGLEAEGESLFTRKYNCTTCHNENIDGYFSGSFMNIGLETPYTDNGLGVISRDAADNGKFKVPNLRNVTLTAPYMHDGRFKTLDEVLDHYSHGIQDDVNLDESLKDASGKAMRMNISTQEKEAIKAFLAALTDADMITNPAYSDPFKIR